MPSSRPRRLRILAICTMLWRPLSASTSTRSARRAARRSAWAGTGPVSVRICMLLGAGWGRVDSPEKAREWVRWASKNGVDGIKFFINGDETRKRQWELIDAGNGRVRAEFVRELTFGSRAYVRFEHRARPIAAQVYHSVRQVLLAHLGY